MSQPETSFRIGVERHLPSKNELHREKMSNPYSGGTADSWYSGSLGDLWVEYKFIAVPKRDATVIDLNAGKRPTLSPLQLDWLNRRFAEGRNVSVVVGCAEGGVILLARLWETPMTAREFRSRLVDRKSIAAWIARETLR